MNDGDQKGCYHLSYQSRTCARDAGLWSCDLRRAETAGGDTATTPPKAQATKGSAVDAADAGGDASSSKAVRTSKAHKTGLARLLTRPGSRSPRTRPGQVAQSKKDLAAHA